MRLDPWPAGAANYGSLVTAIGFSGPDAFVAYGELGRAMGVEGRRERWRFDPGTYSGATAALPGGRLLLTGLKDRHLCRLDPLTGRVDGAWPLPDDVEHLDGIVLSPDGRHALLQVGLRIEDGEGIYGWYVSTGFMLWDLQEERLRWRDDRGRHYIGRGWFSPDGREVLLPPQGNVHEWRDVRTGEATRGFPRVEMWGNFHFCGPASRAVIELGSAPWHLAIQDTGTGAVEPLPGGEGQQQVIAVAGDRALTITRDGQLQRWDLAAGRLVDAFRPEAPQVGYPGAFLPDGSGALLALVDGRFATLAF